MPCIRGSILQEKTKAKLHASFCIVMGLIAMHQCFQFDVGDVWAALFASGALAGMGISWLRDL